MLYADRPNEWKPNMMPWPLNGSVAGSLEKITEQNKSLDFIASFMQMKVPRGQSYVLQDLLPTDFEYKLVKQAFEGTASPEFDKQARGGQPLGMQVNPNG